MKIKLALISVVLLSLITNSFAKQATSDQALIQCTGKYALCDASGCKKNGDGTTAMCNCPVYDGANWGLATCKQRAAMTATNEVYSEYSPRNLLGSSGNGVAAKKLFKPYDLCSGSSSTGQQYADCFDVLCQLNSDQKSADCPCRVVTSKVESNIGFLVESNNCQEAEQLCQQYTSSSSSGVVNSSPMAINIKIVEKTLNYYGKSLDKSMFCTPKNTGKSTISHDAKTDLLTGNVSDDSNASNGNNTLSDSRAHSNNDAINK